MKTIIKPKSYITDEAGHKTQVILSNKDFKRLVEDYNDLLSIADRKNEESDTLETFMSNLNINVKL